MIEAHNLTKYYQKKAAVSHLDLAVERGCIFGLLGPNAAGKTSTIRILCGILQSDEGSVLIDGKSVAEAKGDFGYVSQHFGQYEELSVWENLRFYAEMYGVKDKARLDMLLERYKLAPFRDRAAGKLSGGYQRRLAIACALSHDPDVLFLDEPTAGIDPVTRKLIWDDFYALSAEGKTLFVTTHYMEEAQRCHELAFISQGRIIAQGTPHTITKALGAVQVYTLKVDYQPQIVAALEGVEGIELINQFGDELRIVAKEKVEKAPLEAALRSIDATLPSLSLSKPNLEDVFIALMEDEV